MPGPLLYSCNPFLKFHINGQFRGDVHYVWCSETFDSTKHGSYTSASMVAPSSDPYAIFKQLAAESARNDRHADKITQLKANMLARAVIWEAAGEISADDLGEITYMVANATHEWRPLLYIIPRNAVASRLQSVPPQLRASLGPEFIIPDLARDEFDVIEL